jgi:hypothetical protein
MTDQVIIGMDPHKASNTIAVLARDETPLTRRRFAWGKRAHQPFGWHRS